ncbi:MAG: amidohydrolase [Planctomycetales bacterium]|nr:amidohydrolase [Planctomycetales bacterium]
MASSIKTLVLLCIATGVGPLLFAQQDPARHGVKHLVDTHIHIYDTERDVYQPTSVNPVPWPPADDSVLHQPHLPQEFHRIAESAGVTAVVIVEASPRLDDNRWVLDLVKGDKLFVGLVGNIDPFQESFGSALDAFKSEPRFVGVRAHFMNRGDDFANDQTLANSLRQLARAGLTLDVLMNGEGSSTIDQVSKIASQFPDLKIVVNHVLGYDIDGEAPDRVWLDSMQELSRNENVHVKISGLYQRSLVQPAPQTINFYQGLLEPLWKSFGQDRLIYGSNWPVTKKSGSYVSFVKLVDSFISSKGQEARECFFWRNASRVYGLGLE